MYHENINVDSMEENIIQVNGEIKINVGVSVKNVINVKQIIFGILVHTVVNTGNI